VLHETLKGILLRDKEGGVRPSAAHVGTRYDHTRELRLTIAALCFMAVVWFLLGADMLTILTSHLGVGDFQAAGNQTVFMAIIAFMQFSVLVYFLARLGQLYRHRSHQPRDIEELMGHYEGGASSLAILVPSYKEDSFVVRKTLLSAALLDYPSKRVVLLIDDSPTPANEHDRELLERTRKLVADLNCDLGRFSEPFRAALNDYRQRDGKEQVDVRAEFLRIAELYECAARCLEQIRFGTRNRDHEDRWFILESLVKPAAAHKLRAQTFRESAARPGDLIVSADRIAREYFRLSRLFTVEITSFERKRYVNLSHEPNKAMNLNSYLDLMGQTVVADFLAKEPHLRYCEAGEKGHYVPDAEFVITLDADSILSFDYALKLISVMKAQGNERLAVAQTPYSAFPGANTPIERTAGATTDIQYLVHQGFTRFNATFWVGANALLRKQALEDIATKGVERGFPITRYIQDRTVIEDTESSVDLVARGWLLYNYPERLAYSATPPDFGSLLIQRRRWANGGLIIFPKFWRYVTRRPSVPSRMAHTLMGVSYLTSLAVMNIGILVLLWLPLEQPMRSPWLPLAMLPYLLLYTRDLIRSGYRGGDVLRVYALSLLLVPVHLGGVFKSIGQIITGARTPFGRTPKVADRTAVPLLYIVASYGFLLYCASTLFTDIASGRWLHASFAATNATFLAYAIARFVGFRASLEDMRVGVKALIEQVRRPRGLAAVTCEPPGDVVRRSA
jgi:cellulose synthase (UDP-forming)